MHRNDAEMTLNVRKVKLPHVCFTSVHTYQIWTRCVLWPEVSTLQVTCEVYKIINEIWRLPTEVVQTKKKKNDMNLERQYQKR